VVARQEREEKGSMWYPSSDFFCGLPVLHISLEGKDMHLKELQGQLTRAIHGLHWMAYKYLGLRYHVHILGGLEMVVHYLSVLIVVAVR
jgi:hypothetical protein